MEKRLILACKSLTAATFAWGGIGDPAAAQKARQASVAAAAKEFGVKFADLSALVSRIAGDPEIHAIRVALSYLPPCMEAVYRFRLGAVEEAFDGLLLALSSAIVARRDALLREWEEVA